jgi:hypothetical protein
MSVKEKAGAAVEDTREKARKFADGNPVNIESPFSDYGVVVGGGRDRGQLGLQTVLAALVVVIAVSLAVIVVDRFDESLGDPSSSNLSTAQNDVLSGFADMTSLIGPMLLVAIAVVIIGLIRRVS